MEEDTRYERKRERERERNPKKSKKIQKYLTL
jgi:hypothetical protein